MSLEAKLATMLGAISLLVALVSAFAALGAWKAAENSSSAASAQEKRATVAIVRGHASPENSPGIPGLPLPTPAGTTVQLALTNVGAIAAVVTEISVGIEGTTGDLLPTGPSQKLFTNDPKPKLERTGELSGPGTPTSLGLPFVLRSGDAISLNVTPRASMNPYPSHLWENDDQEPWVDEVRVTFDRGRSLVLVRDEPGAVASAQVTLE